MSGEEKSKKLNADRFSSVLRPAASGDSQVGFFAGNEYIEIRNAVARQVVTRRIRKAVVMLKGLVRLIRYMDGLEGPAELPMIDKYLREADVSREDMVQACNFSDVNYARTIFAQSPWYQLIVICWRSGQSSAIHDHRGSQCGVRVVDGIATETVYERTPAGLVRPVREVEYHPNDVCTTSDTGIHVISNRRPQTELVTLHLYSPPLKMTFYKEEEATANEAAV